MIRDGYSSAACIRFIPCLEFLLPLFSDPLSFHRWLFHAFCPFAPFCVVPVFCRAGPCRGPGLRAIQAKDGNTRACSHGQLAAGCIAAGGCGSISGSGGASCRTGSFISGACACNRACCNASRTGGGSCCTTSACRGASCGNASCHAARC
jgi:hypothetical protein